MNRQILEGNWKQLKGRIKERWGELTDDELDVIEGRRDMLVGTLQKRYGITLDEAEKQLREWEKTPIH